MVLFSIHSSVEHGFTVFFGWLPHVLGFLAVLLIGYIVAKVVAKRPLPSPGPRGERTYGELRGFYAAERRALEQTRRGHRRGTP